MKILNIIESLGTGGTERALTYVLPELVARGHEVTVACLQEPHTLVEQLRARGVRVELLSLRHRWSLGEGALKLAAICRRGGFDIVHGRLYFGAMYAAASRPFSPKPRRVVSFHNLAYEYPSQNAWTQIRKSWESLLLRREVDHFAAVSTAVARHYERHLGVGPVQVIPNAVPVEIIKRDLSLDRREVLAPYGVDPSAFILAVPARLVHEKGHRYLFKAAALLKKEGLRLAVITLGAGPMFDETQRLVSDLGLSADVSMKDVEVAHREVLRVMSVADAVVLPSTHEGFPNAAAEAMALGRPLIATSVGGLLDLVEPDRSGLLVPPGDVQALKSAILRFASDPELRGQLGESARRRVESSFDARSIARLWESFYERGITQ
jgi:glycosyltransferase involved in cell wall biosynthesis